MSKPNQPQGAGAAPVGPQPVQQDQTAEQPVTGVVSDAPGEQGNVPAGTAPLTQATPEPVEDERVEVWLAHHWTDPKTSQVYAPRRPAMVDEDTARTLQGAAYLMRAEDIEDARAELEEEEAAAAEKAAAAEEEDDGRRQAGDQKQSGDRKQLQGEDQKQTQGEQINGKA